MDNLFNCTLTNAFTTNDFKKAVDDFNNKMKQIVFVNPKDAELIKDSLSDRFIIKETPYVEQNKCYVINQRDLII